MPIFQTGNMWSVYDDADLFLITTNATIKRNGALVMGRGIALQAKRRFPSLGTTLGQQIRDMCGSGGEYGLLVSSRWPAAKVGAFQVKFHYRQPASLDLIRCSTAALCTWCVDHPDVGVHLNFPGIGNGRLRHEDVLPIVSQLPDQVAIWEYAPAGKENTP